MFVDPVCSYHSELWGDQVGVLHSSVESQKAVGAPAEQHGFQRSVWIELQMGMSKQRRGQRIGDECGKE